MFLHSRLGLSVVLIIFFFNVSHSKSSREFIQFIENLDLFFTARKKAGSLWCSKVIDFKQESVYILNVFTKGATFMGLLYTWKKA